MRTPAQAWQWPSVGGCCPSDTTQGQNTVQLQLRISSPLIAQGSNVPGSSNGMCLSPPVQINSDRRKAPPKPAGEKQATQRPRQPTPQIGQFLDHHDRRR